MKKLIIPLLFVTCLLQGQQYIKNSDGFPIYFMRNGSRYFVDYNTTPQYNDRADSLFARFSYTYDNYTKRIISNWYDTIEKYNIYDSLDSRFFLALENETDAKIDWMRNINADAINTPVFEKYNGYTSNGTSSYLRLNYNPAVDADKFKLSSGSISYKINTNSIVSARWSWGIRDATHAIGLRNEPTNNLFYFNRLSAAATYANSSNIYRYSIISRNINNVYFKKGNTGYVSQSYSYTGIPNHTGGIYLGCLNNQGIAGNFDANQYSIFNIGGYLDGTQSQSLYLADSILLAHFREPLIIIAGQSNAGGRGYDNVDSVDNDSYLNTASNVGYIINDIDGDDNFAPLVIGTNSSDYGGRFGLEASYINLLSQIRDTVFVAKCVHGGSPIRYFMTGGQYNDELVNTINNALNKSGKKSIELIWYQGENDWFEQSTTYYNDLTNFMNQLKQDINGSILRIIIVEIRYDLFPFHTSVIDAIKQYCNENSNVYYMSITGLGHLDHTHLNSQGQIDLGEKFFYKQYYETAPE